MLVPNINSKEWNDIKDLPNEAKHASRNTSHVEDFFGELWMMVILPIVILSLLLIIDLKKLPKWIWMEMK